MIEAAQNLLLCKKVLSDFPYKLTTHSMSPLINPQFVNWLCKEASSLFEKEPNLIEAFSPTIIIGDIQGQFDDLVKIFKLSNIQVNQRYIFLGNYLEYEQQSIETLCLLYMLKIFYPKNIILLRGNHESRSIGKTSGFSNDCEQRLSIECANHFYDSFDKMPLCTVVDNKIFCVHAGISKDIRSLDEIRNIKRFGEISTNNFIYDLLTSGPSKFCKEWKKNEKCDSFLWGIELANKFMYNNDLKVIVRGNQTVENGVLV